MQLGNGENVDEVYAAAKQAVADQEMQPGGTQWTGAGDEAGDEGGDEDGAPASPLAGVGLLDASALQAPTTGEEDPSTSK